MACSTAAVTTQTPKMREGAGHVNHDAVGVAEARIGEVEIDGDFMRAMIQAHPLFQGANAPGR